MAECRVVVERDSCAVRTPALGGVVREWVDRWNRDHPDLAGYRQENGRRVGGGGREENRNSLGHLTGNGGVGAVTILHERSGVSVTTIQRILKSRGRFTDLRTADMLVTAIERPEVFHDGTLPVMPNPRASGPNRALCCGGSLNGSLGY